MKLIAWDIEAANLSANFGVVLCVGLKELGKKPQVLSLLDFGWEGGGDIFTVEKRLLRVVARRLLEADCWLSHYGVRFDLPYLNTRLLYHNLPPLPTKFPHIDTWRAARYGLKLHSNRLAAIQEFFGSEHEKNAIKPGLWIRALTGHAPSMRYIIDHCKRDVCVLEEMYLKLRPLVVDHPNKDLIDNDGGCRVCGSKRMQRRGFHITRTRRYQRFQCQECGTWSRAVAFEKRAKVT